MQQETEWSHRTFFGWRREFARLIGHYQFEMNRTRKKLESRINDKHLATRRLILDLAARDYELDKGHRPASAADLVPEYLKAVPQDPVTGTNIILP